MVNTPSDSVGSMIDDTWSLFFMRQLLAISQQMQHLEVETTMPVTMSGTAGYWAAHCTKRALFPLNRKSANRRKTALRFVCSHVAE